MSFSKKLLITRFVVFLGLAILTVALAPKAKGFSEDSALVAISQNGLEKINPADKTNLTSDTLVIKTKLEEEIEERNKKRLDHYKPRLSSYSPPNGKMSILVTGYSSTPDQTWGDPFTTASGTHVHEGTMACPPQYPFGVKVKIEGRGTFVCEDRGGAIKGNHFDMWFSSRREALNWGKRIVTAEIIK